MGGWTACGVAVLGVLIGGWALMVDGPLIVVEPVEPVGAPSEVVPEPLAASSTAAPLEIARAEDALSRRVELVERVDKVRDVLRRQGYTDAELVAFEERARVLEARLEASAAEVDRVRRGL